ncbi:MAG: hypothetical protein FXF47_03655 [Candidatus Mcinerneyibacterium aminivorans]|uniref:NADH:quinone oxidoreductase/Mrp antiporter transmembrane domain-containing protein n=1 Tax=Candidatus Mcinerneyibacterium aminivorans TaxID=2703815 RepID=A0A5D0MIS7_9BACT|nr:MAG: hypothetical protein FXF47_03655 [Candidatus Mcinerneyibacterium aminivorans]
MINEPVLLIVIPLFAGFLIPIIYLISKKAIKYIPIIAVFYNLFVLIRLIQINSTSLSYFTTGGYKVPFGINLIFNSQIGIILFAINLLALIALIFFLKKEFHLVNSFAYTLGFIIAISAVNGMVLTGDLFNLFVFMELAAIAGYIIATHKRGYYPSFLYVIISTFGSLLFLLGTITIYNVSGTLNMASVSENLVDVSPHFIVVLSVMFIVALSSESELLPLNAWVPKVYEKTSITGSIFFGSVLSTAALFAVIKVLVLVFKGGYEYLFNSLTIIGLATLLIGEFVAFKQRNVRKIVAYSSIAQAGLIISAVSVSLKNGTITDSIFNAAMFQLLNNIFAKGLILLGVGLLGYYSFEKLKGIAGKKKFASILITIGVLSIIGMPPFAGFWSKFFLIKSLIANKMIIFVAIFLASAIFEVYYYLRFIQNMYYEEFDSKIKINQISAVSYFLMISLSFMIIYIGFNPSSVMKTISDIFTGGII